MIAAAVASACVVPTAQAQDAVSQLEEQGSGHLPTKRPALRTGHRQLEEQGGIVRPKDIKAVTPKPGAVSGGAAVISRHLEEQGGIVRPKDIKAVTPKPGAIAGAALVS